jgi:hypothetical protein
MRLVYIRESLDHEWFNILDCRTSGLIDQAHTRIGAIEMCTDQNLDVRDGPMSEQDWNIEMGIEEEEEEEEGLFLVEGDEIELATNVYDREEPWDQPEEEVKGEELDFDIRGTQNG